MTYVGVEPRLNGNRPIKPHYRIVRGMRMPLGFSPAGLASGLAYRAVAGDLFVASYPKSGTTWLQYIVLLLVRGQTLGADESLTTPFPHLEEVGAGVVGAVPEPRLIKTHLIAGLTPWSPGGRYLVIARNPFDCAVSFFHHTRGFPRHYDFAGGRFAGFFDCFIAGEVDFGDYFDHLLSWHATAELSNVLWLTYEDLKTDPRATIRRIAGFLGDQATGAVATGAGLDRLIAETSFPAMQRHQERWSSTRPDGAPAFVRKGVIGDWTSLFTREQARALLAKFDRRLAGTSLAGLWPDVIAAARGFAHRG